MPELRKDQRDFVKPEWVGIVKRTLRAVILSRFESVGGHESHADMDAIAGALTWGIVEHMQTSNKTFEEQLKIDYPFVEKIL